MRFAANIEALWSDLPWADRFDAAAAAGFKAVEAPFPYDQPMPATQSALRRNGLRFLALNCPPPNYTGGERGFAAVPGLEGRFAHDLRRVLRYADALGAGIVHVMAGVTSGLAAQDTLIMNLHRALEQLPKGVALCLKPLSPDFAPGYFLQDFDMAAEVIARLDHPALGLQFDTAHAQEITGDAVAAFERYQPLIRHIQLADAPDRAVPGTGGLDLPAVFNAIKSSDYSGWISADYRTTGPVEDTLGWRDLV